MSATDFKLLRGEDFEALAPPTQWSLVEFAYQSLRVTDAGKILPPIFIVSIFIVTVQLWCLAWFGAALAGVAVGRRVAGHFHHQATDRSPGAHAQNYTLAVWCQAALLGAGGLGAAADGNPVTCVLIALPIAFAMANTCATAVLTRTAQVAVVLLAVPLLAACLVHVVWRHGAPIFAVLAGFFLLWVAGALPMAAAAAARMKLLALATVEATRATAALDGQMALLPGAEAFQGLLGRDQLTGLLNRPSFMHLLAQESARAFRAAVPLSVIMLEWDEHEALVAAGSKSSVDEDVQQIVKRLLAALQRPADQLARLGDGRFAVVLPGTDAFGAHSVAQNLFRSVTGAEGVAGVSLSAGTASYCGKGLLPETQLLQLASLALRDARVNGGNQVKRFDMATKGIRKEVVLF